MNRNFVLGQYVPGNSYLYRLDPRVKIISTILLMVSVFFLENYYEILGALALILLILISGRISIIKAIRGLKPLLVLSLFVFFFQVFFNQTGSVIYTQDFYFSFVSAIVFIVVTLIFLFIRRYSKFKFILLLLYLVSLYLSLSWASGISYRMRYITYVLEIYDKVLKKDNYSLSSKVFISSFLFILLMFFMPFSLAKSFNSCTVKSDKEASL